MQDFVLLKTKQWATKAPNNKQNCTRCRFIRCLMALLLQLDCSILKRREHIWAGNFTDKSVEQWWVLKTDKDFQLHLTEFSAYSETTTTTTILNKKLLIFWLFIFGIKIVEKSLHSSHFKQVEQIVKYQKYHNNAKTKNWTLWKNSYGIN